MNERVIDDAIARREADKDRAAEGWMNESLWETHSKNRWLP